MSRAYNLFDGKNDRLIYTYIEFHIIIIDGLRK